MDFAHLSGSEDWNTGLEATRATLAKHLEELQDLGVTMLRLDAASYVSAEDLAAILNRMPWDVVHQEWWGGVPHVERSELVGHYRDQKYGLKIANGLGVGDVKYMAKLLNITQGLEGIPPERAVYPLTFHDARTWEPDRFVPTYMRLGVAVSERFCMENIGMYLQKGAVSRLFSTENMVVSFVVSRF